MTRVSGTLVVLAGTIVLALSGGPSTLTSAGGGPRGDGAEGSGADALTRASAAALAEIEGGRVTGTEISDEDSYYEVEITLGDGQQVTSSWTLPSTSSTAMPTWGRRGTPTEGADRQLNRSAALQEQGEASTSYSTDASGRQP